MYIAEPPPGVQLSALLAQALSRALKSPLPLPLEPLLACPAGQLDTLRAALLPAAPEAAGVAPVWASFCSAAPLLHTMASMHISWPWQHAAKSHILKPPSHCRHQAHLTCWHLVPRATQAARCCPPTWRCCS